MADTAEKAAPDKPEARRSKPWLDRIDRAIKREKSWRDRGKKVVQRFRDERSRRESGVTSRINILWSNTEVLKAALYSRTAIPDVRRRFPDANGGDPLARTAAEVIERALSYCNDAYDVDAPVEAALADALLPGRGVVWVVYEPEIVGDDENASIGEQTLREEYVYWEDYVEGYARQPDQVPWKARRHTPSLAAFKKRFPDAKEEPDADFALIDASGSSEEAAEEDKFVELWEVWDKSTKERIYVARGFLDEVQRDEDPLHLSGFFPTVRPLYSVTTTDRLIPEPEYCLYQDQAEELDRVAERIRSLTEQLKWKGIYDGSIDGENILATLAGAADGDFIPYPNWNQLKEKGGIEAAVGFWPIDRIVAALQQLYPRAQQLIQEIYQITGISDIIRGATDPNETLGAQKLKSQFGSMRMQKRQRDVQRFIRDLFRIKAEIIAEHFTQETLAAITSIDMPTAEEQMELKAKVAMAEQAKAMMGHNGGPPMDEESPDAAMASETSGMPGMGTAPPAQAVAPAMPEIPEVSEEVIARAEGPNWDDLMDLLRSDKMRGYRIDIETDSTIFVDAEAEKQSRIELITAIGGMLQQAMGMIAASPGTIPLVRELVLFGVRSFKPGRALEEAFEDAFDALAASPPTPEDDEEDKPEETGPDLKGMAAIGDVKRKAARDAEEMELERQRFGVEAAETVETARREDAKAEAEIREGEVGTLVKAFTAESNAEAQARKAMQRPAATNGAER